MIAYLCGSASWGGLEMNQWRNARWMHDRGHQVVVLGLNNSPLQQACLESGIDFECIGKHRKHYDFKSAFELRSIIRKRKITRLIVRDGRDMGLATLTKVLSLKRFQVHYFMEMQLGRVKKNPAQTLRFLLLDSWVCPLEWLVHETTENTFMPRKRIRHIPVGIEFSAFQSEISRMEARRMLKLPEEGLLIGLAARIDPQKGQLLLLQALQLLDDLPVTVALLGSPTLNEDDSYYRSLLRFIEQQDLKSRVYCLPFRKDHPVFYKAVDALVMASKAETCGMVTIEAMASGIPVIGSNAGGTPELLQNGQIGYLFETMNPESLAEQIRTFVTNPMLYKHTALQTAIRKFDHVTVCEKVETLLKVNH